MTTPRKKAQGTKDEEAFVNLFQISLYLARLFGTLIMNGRIFVSILILFLALQFSPAFQSKKPGKDSPSSLLGTWQASEEGETATLVFKSPTSLVFDGEESQYTLLPGAIRVQEEFGQTDYRYTLKGDVLTIVFPEGEQLRFRRITSSTASANARGDQPVQPVGKGGTNQNHLLVGKFMSFSSASSSSGSSSWTTYATFDGRGNFTWSSESAHNTRNYDQQGNQTGAGIAYGADDGNRGTYRVVGNKIVVTFGDRSTDEAEVTERFSDGSIGGHSNTTEKRLLDRFSVASFFLQHGAGFPVN